jgi:hypothetical protein
MFCCAEGRRVTENVHELEREGVCVEDGIVTNLLQGMACFNGEELSENPRKA